jgi:hypothetical protein
VVFDLRVFGTAANADADTEPPPPRCSGAADRHGRVAVTRYKHAMMGPLDRRLARLETAAGVGMVLPVIFVSFVAPDGTKRLCDTPTVNGKVWHREAGEPDDTFRSRVAVEARPARPGCGIVAVLK